MNDKDSEAEWQLVSDIPGRLRLRVPHHDTQSLDQLVQKLKEKPGVSSVEANPRARSLLIRYAAERDDVLTMLHDAGAAFAQASSAGGETPGTEGGSGVVGAVADLDQRLKRLTGLDVKARSLLPLGLAAIGVWRTLQSGLGFSQMPAFILLWYAFDSYFKLNVDPKKLFPPDGPDKEHEVRRTVEDTVGEAAAS